MAIKMITNDPNLSPRQKFIIARNNNININSSLKALIMKYKILLFFCYIFYNQLLLFYVHKNQYPKGLKLLLNNMDIVCVSLSFLSFFY